MKNENEKQGLEKIKKLKCWVAIKEEEKNSAGGGETKVKRSKHLSIIIQK